jgi:Flp pilus assembly protein TadG
LRPTREKQLRKQRQGASTVEFAITLPVLLLMIMLTFEVSRMMMVQQCMNYAAQEGSRAASLATTLSDSQVDTAVRNALRATITDSNNTATVGVAVTPTVTAAIASGTPVTVNVQVQYSDVSWLPGSFLNYLGNPTLTAQSIQDRE